MLHEAALECARHDFILMQHESFHTCPLKRTDGAGTHVDHLLVVVGNALIGNPLQYPLLLFGEEEIQQQVLRLFKGDDLQFVRILDVHNLIADVVGGFYQIHQRMSHIL